MFTIENSANDLLANEIVKKHFSYMMPNLFIQIVPKKFRDLPLKELPDKVRMPWGIPYISEEIVNVANQLIDLKTNKEKYQFVQLWAEETPEDYFPTMNDGRDGVGLLMFKEDFVPGKPIALVVPGGAYMTVAISNEGLFTAQALKNAGYAVAILNYRCKPDYYPAPQKDLAIAMKFLRSFAKEQHMSDEILTIGYSAGGHLTACENCYAEEYEAMVMADLKEEMPELYKKYQGISVKADQVCLSYTVVDLLEDEVCYGNLAGEDQSLRDKVSVFLHVNSDYPKTFLWACEDDQTVPVSNSTRMYDALQAAGVESMCKIYPTGDHGIALGEGTSAEGWLEEMLTFMK